MMTSSRAEVWTERDILEVTLWSERLDVVAVVKSPIYAEVYEFLLSSPTAEQVVVFKPSEAIEERARVLLEANRQQQLTATR